MAIWSYLRGPNTLDIKVGYGCNNDCIHCVVRPVREDLVARNERPNLETEEILGLIDGAVNANLTGIVLTGGEVTIRPDFARLASYATDKDLDVIIQTNARLLSDPGVLGSLARLPHLTFIIALHAPTSEVHDAITGRRGSFEQTTKAIRMLKSQDRVIIGKIVISALNADFIFETAILSRELGVDEFSVVFPHMPSWVKREYRKIVPRYTSIERQISAVAEYSEAHGFWTDFETLPFCVCPDCESFWKRNCDMISKARQSMRSNCATNIRDGLLDWEILRPSMKLKAEQCSQCVFDRLCEGTWSEYSESYGTNEFRAVPSSRVKSFIENLEQKL